MIKPLNEAEQKYLYCLKETGMYKIYKNRSDTRCNEETLFNVFCEYCRLHNIHSFVSRNFRSNDHFCDKQYGASVYNDINMFLSNGERKNVTRYGLSEGLLGHVSKTRYYFKGEEE